MKVVNRYDRTDREKINIERCKIPGSIYRIDLSCNRVTTYNIEFMQSEDYKFGNVFAFKGEADRALVEVVKFNNYFNNVYGKMNYYELIRTSVYIILDNGDISRITKASVQEENEKNIRFGFSIWTFEQYIKSWYDVNNCFDSLSRAAIARNKIADIFENVKSGRCK
ncbi:MAG: hypothetical protein FWD71_17835 [Oscillospiraceae bacterium]|nr:hypothetical protein [Oscillospiraceae bacterium]